MDLLHQYPHVIGVAVAVLAIALVGRFFFAGSKAPAKKTPPKVSGKEEIEEVATDSVAAEGWL